MIFAGWTRDGPGIDRPRQRLAVAVDDVAALGDQAVTPSLRPAWSPNAASHRMRSAMRAMIPA